MKSDSDLVLFVGATSKVGRAAVPLLLREGRAVRAMTREPSRASDLSRLGAEVVAGDLRDPASLRRAVDGVRQVVASAHAMLSQGTNTPERVDGRGNRDLIDAARDAGVEQLVFVSARAAESASPVDFFRIKRDIEIYLASSGLKYTILRASPFMETTAELLGEGIAKRGLAVIFGRGDIPINFISASDVARFLVLALGDSALSDRSLDLGGPESLTMLAVVETLEQACGRKARRVHIPVPALRALARLTRRVHPLAHRMLTTAALVATTPDDFDVTGTPERYPRPATRFEQVAHRYLRSASA